MALRFASYLNFDSTCRFPFTRVSRECPDHRHSTSGPSQRYLGNDIIKCFVFSSSQGWIRAIPGRRRHDQGFDFTAMTL